MANAPKASSRIADNEHVARYLGRTLLEVCPNTGAILGVLNSGFALRTEIDEKELSVNHLQYFPGAMLDQVKAIKAAKVASGFKVRSTSAFAVLEAGQFTDIGKKSTLSIAVYKEPLPSDPSHAEVRGMPQDNGRLDLLEDLARIASKLLFESKNL